MSFHRNGKDSVAIFLYEPAHARAFGTDNESQRPFEVGFTVRRAVHVGTIDPYALFFELFYGFGEVRHPRDRHIFERPGACFSDYAGQTCRASFGDYHAVNAAALGGTDYRAEIVGILYRIADYYKRRLVLFARGGENFVNGRVFVRGGGHYYALMVAVSAHEIELFGVDLFNGNAPFAALGDYGRQCAGLFAPCNKDAVYRSAAFERFLCGVAPDYKVAAVVLSALLFDRCVVIAVFEAAPVFISFAVITGLKTASVFVFFAVVTD